MSKSILKFCILTAFILSGAARSNCQNDLPEVFKEGTIPEQLKFLDEKTRIYDNYRAIREDMFRSISKNTLDTLKNAKNRINGLILHTTTLDNRIDSLNKSMQANIDALKEMTRTKNSISVLGLEVNKTTYNSVLWTILAALVFLLVIGYLTFKQNRAITVKTKKELHELNGKYEEYQIKTRLEREKMNIDHFNEIKKLKASSSNRA